MKIEPGTCIWIAYTSGCVPDSFYLSESSKTKFAVLEAQTV